MLDVKIVDVEAFPMLYQERSCSMDPGDISSNMGSAFGAVAEFAAQQQVASLGRALSVYRDYDPDKMNFQAGFFVSADDAAKASGATHAGHLPAGRALNTIHRGPYAKLRDTYAELMSYMEKEGLGMGGVSWEVYLNDPSTVASEEDLETDIYIMLQ